MRYLIKYLMDFLALALLYVFFHFKKWRSKGKNVLFVNTLMYTYLSFVLFFTLMPIIASLPFLFDHPYTPMIMRPFFDVILGRGDFVRQVGLNVLMTVPFGFLFPMTEKGNPKLIKTVLHCFLLSLGIELLQPLISNSRSSDITDIITNVTGGIVGYLLYLLFKPITSFILERTKDC